MRTAADSRPCFADRITFGLGNVLEEETIAIDRGLGAAAVAAIGSLPIGVRRDFEIATWGKRAAVSGVRIVITSRGPEEHKIAVALRARIAVEIEGSIAELRVEGDELRRALAGGVW